MVGAGAASEPDFPSWYQQHHRRLVASVLLLSGDVAVARDVVDEAFAQGLRPASVSQPPGMYVVRGGVLVPSDPRGN